MSGKLVFDSTDAVLGRIGSVVAKELLKGSSVVIINSEKTIISGDLKSFVERINQKIKMGQGSSLKGPKYIRKSDMLLKRMIRGMLPWDRAKGRDAFDRLRCYVGHGNLSDNEVAKAVKFNHQKPKNFVTLGEVTKMLKNE